MLTESLQNGVVTRAGLRHNAWQSHSDAQIDDNMALFERLSIAFVS
jgi:hypothetical protein